MQAKRHSFLLSTPRSKRWKAVLQQQKFWKVSGQTELGNEELDLK